MKAKKVVRKIKKGSKKNKSAFIKFKKGAKEIARSSAVVSRSAVQGTQKAANVVKNQIQSRVIKKNGFKKGFKTLLILSGYASLIFVIFIILKHGYSFKDLKSMQREVARNSEIKVVAAIQKEKPTHIAQAAEIQPFDFGKTDLEKVEFNKKVPILMYHYIEPIDPHQTRLRNNLTVSPAKFEEQVKYLADNGFTALTMTDYFSKIAQGSELPKKPVLITVDDGYRNFYLNAAPILNKYNEKATSFIISGSVGLPAYMTWDMMRELYKEGFEFGSHSITHANLKTLKDGKLEEELQDSKWEIEQQIGGSVNFMCYPSGFYDSRVIDFTRAAGYKGALTTGSGMDMSNKNIFEMYRLRISDDMDISKFAWTVNQAYQQ